MVLMDGVVIRTEHRKGDQGTYHKLPLLLAWGFVVVSPAGITAPPMLEVLDASYVGWTWDAVCGYYRYPCKKIASHSCSTHVRAS